MAKIPAHLGRYRLVRLLGQGGMGQVFEAVQQGLERHVALKVLPPQYLSQPGFLKRFHREARAAAMLSHPNVVTIYEIASVKSDLTTQMSSAMAPVCGNNSLSHKPLRPWR